MSTELHARIVFTRFLVCSGTRFAIHRVLYLRYNKDIPGCLPSSFLCLGDPRHFPPERTKRILSHKREFIVMFLPHSWDLTPFCSCSAVPLFIWLLKQGASRCHILIPDLSPRSTRWLWSALGLFGWKIALI